MRTQQQAAGQAKPVEIVFERRSEQRESASGEVTLRMNDGNDAVHAEMVDVSRTGFRIRYRGEPPQKIKSDTDISYPWGHVKASLIWIRAVDGWIELGFLVTG